MRMNLYINKGGVKLLLKYKWKCKKQALHYPTYSFDTIFYHLLSVLNEDANYNESASLQSAPLWSCGGVEAGFT